MWDWGGYTNVFPRSVIPSGAGNPIAWGSLPLSGKTLAGLHLGNEILRRCGWLRMTAYVAVAMSTVMLGQRLPETCHSERSVESHCLG